VEVDIGVGGGEVIEQHIQKNSVTQGWRLAFQVKKKTGPLDRVTAGNDQPLELRAFLRLGDEILTETWSYVDPF
jgi:glucans biosynthesis protein